MPKMGGKIWFTAIAGLLLGFVLFGMLQRGCDAQGEATVATADRVEPQARDFDAAARSNARTISPSNNSNSNANSARGRRSGARDNARSRRDSQSANRPRATRTPRSALERNTRTRNRADAARKAELARLTRERTARYRERSRRARADDPNIIDPALRTSTTGASIESQVALSAAAVGDELRSRRGEGGAGSGSGAIGDIGGAGQARGENAGDGDSGDSGSDAPDEFAEIAALLEGLGIDDSFVELIRQVVTGGAPPSNPFIDIGDDDDDDVSQPVDPNPIDPVDISTPVLARWLPVEQTGCASLGNQGLETRDLYLAFLVQPIAPPVVSSTEENSIVILDGFFHQDAFGTNGPPSTAGDDCLSYDSYLTIGQASPTFLSAPNVENWGDRLLAEWFAIFGAEIDQSQSKFGNQRFHIHVGRFTAEDEAKIFGSLRVDYAGQLAFVDVPDWKGADVGGLDDDIPPVQPKVDSVQFDSSGVLGGSSLLGTVTIDREAPEEGLEILLTTDRPDRVMIPSSVLIPSGETAAMFEIRTTATGVVEDATITAIGPDSDASSTLRLEAPALVSFSLLKTRLLDGESTSAVLALTNPAVEGGTTITLDVDNANAVTIPSSVRIPEGQLRTVVRIMAQDVQSTQEVTIRASAGGVTRSVSVEVVPTVTLVDGNHDGVVDTADLGMLIAAWGTDDPLFDFNGDGVVDTADLGLLNSKFGETYDVDAGGDGPGDGPGGGDDDAVLARWIEIPQVDCDEFPGTRTAELYVGFLDGPSLPVITSSAETGITISNGEFIQHQFGSNNPPTAAVIQSFPCVQYDSFLSVGDADPVILGILDTVNWGTTLDAAWFSIEGTSEQNPGKFGDDRHYVRIARFTAQAAATIAGSVRLDYAGELSIVEIQDWTIAAAFALDLNFDGQIDAGDVSIVTRAYGKSNPAYDFDGDGVVDGDDLRPLLDAIQLRSGQ